MTHRDTKKNHGIYITALKRVDNKNNNNNGCRVWRSEANTEDLCHIYVLILNLCGKDSLTYDEAVLICVRGPFPRLYTIHLTARTEFDENY